MQTTTVTLSELVDRALFELEAPSERGKPVVLASVLDAVDDTTFTLSSGSLQESDLVEFGSELLLVTGKSADATPVYTVQRAYYNTTIAAHAISAVGYANPQFPRRRVADFIDRSLVRLEALGAPLLVTDVFAREEGMRVIVLPAEARQVLRVTYYNDESGRLLDLNGWEQYFVPTDVASTGNVLSSPYYATDDDELIITYTAPYSWTGTFPDEDATLTLHAAATDLPASYATAMLLSGREISRQQLDRASEWSQTEPMRGSGGGAVVRAKWQDFYRALDEARRVIAVDVPVHRPMQRRPRTPGV